MPVPETVEQWRAQCDALNRDRIALSEALRLARQGHAEVVRDRDRVVRALEDSMRDHRQVARVSGEEVSVRVRETARPRLYVVSVEFDMGLARQMADHPPESVAVSIGNMVGEQVSREVRRAVQGYLASQPAVATVAQPTTPIYDGCTTAMSTQRPVTVSTPGSGDAISYCDNNRQTNTVSGWTNSWGSTSLHNPPYWINNTPPAPLANAIEPVADSEDDEGEEAEDEEDDLDDEDRYEDWEDDEDDEDDEDL